MNFGIILHFVMHQMHWRGIKLKLYNAARYQSVSRACAGHYLVVYKELHVQYSLPLCDFKRLHNIV